MPVSDNACTDLAGADRFATSADVASCLAYLRSSSGDKPIGLAGIATGTAYPDALTRGAFMAYFDAPLLLTDPKTLSPETANALHTVSPHFNLVEIFGGTNAVSHRHDVVDPAGLGRAGCRFGAGRSVGCSRRPGARGLGASGLLCWFRDFGPAGGFPAGRSSVGV